MDFLKSCTTNLYAVEGYSSIDYQIYTAPHPDQDASAVSKDGPSLQQPWTEERHAILVELRRRGALVQSAAVQKKMCVFGGFQQAEEHMKHLRWPLALSGRLDVSSLSRPGPDAKVNLTNQNIYGMFLSAVEESLSITLGNKCRALRVGHMTWILPAIPPQDMPYHTPDSAPEYYLLTLRTQITSIGNLLLLPDVVPTGFNALSDPLEDAKPVLLAPSGTAASTAQDMSCLSLKDGESDANRFRRQARKEARARLAQKQREDSWKSSVRARLGHTTAVPVILDDTTSWTRVRVPTPRPAIDLTQSSSADRTKPVLPAHSCLWPTKLCFDLSGPSVSSQTEPRDNEMDWIMSGHYQDPLEDALRWFMDKDKRDEEILAERKKVDVEKEAAVSSHPDAIPDQVALSSPVNIRAQDQISVNGIYPTPPDAILPAIFSDATAPTAPTEDAGPAEDLTLTRQPSNNSPSVQDNDQSRKDSTDELFGDADEEMFGAPDADLTDVDFSFFDDTDASANNRGRPGNLTGEAVSEHSTEKAPILPGNVEYTSVRNGPPTAPPTGPENTQETGSNTVEASTPGLGDNSTGLGIQAAGVTEKTAFTASPELLHDHSPSKPLERFQTPPLSPLQIKEKLLPSPVPASTRGQEGLHMTSRPRRTSNFDPVVFKEDVGTFDAKYRTLGRFSGDTHVKTRDADKQAGLSTLKSNRRQSAIDLPLRKPVSKAKRFGPARANAPDTTIVEVEEESSSYESETGSDPSDAESEGAPPSYTFGKRKRMLADDGISMQSPRTYTDNDSDVESAISEDKSVVDYNSILDLLLSRDGHKDPQRGLQESQHKFGERPSVWKSAGKRSASTNLSESGDMWDIFDFTQEDMISIAQIVAQQSINTESNTGDGKVHNQHDWSDNLSPEHNDRSLMATYATAQSAVKHVFSASVYCDFSKLASIISVHAEQAPAQKNQPRPVPVPRRPNGPTGAQHLFAIQPPSVHLQRAGSPWEMLPSSLKFWEPLSLEPANGPKNVSAYAIYPNSGDFGDAVQDFLDNIGLAYQNCKLGTHARGATYTLFNDGLVEFQLPEDCSTRSFIESMRAACVEFGNLLREEAQEAPIESGRTLVIYMFSPSNNEVLTKYLCGCFWALQQAFAEGSDSDDILSDFVLQVVPIDRIAKIGALAIPESSWLSALACQVYDRIPLREALDPKSVWVIPSAPSIQLISPLPRRINFALHEHPPKSLLEEAQILHVAYAISSDNTWLTAVWSDNTGKYQFNTSFYVKDLDGKGVLSEVRDMTLSLARTTTWRIFVARVGSMRNWEKEVWKEQPSENWSILLLDIDVAPTLQISATETTANFPAVPQCGAGFLTPASTPQPANFTVSPEAHGGAPSTPVEQPQDTTNPPDPDAYLIDATDETWGLVLPFSAVHGPYELKRTLSSGILLKRGNIDTRTLPSLGVDIIDMVMPKMGEGQASWLAPRSPDAILREVLSWYRGLGMLARLRGLDESGAVPWHVKVACRGSEALAGFMDQ